MINIILCGYNGAMGKHLIEQIEANANLSVSAGIDRTKNANYNFPQFKNFRELQGAMDDMPSGDVIIDFSHHTLINDLLIFSMANEIPAVICTTGLDDEIKGQINRASESVALFQSGNMSLGINLLMHLSKKAAEVLGEDYDIEIIEKHHHRKLDAPSGTALMIADEINTAFSGKMHYQHGRHGTDAKRQVNEIGIHAVRGGNIVGDHEVIFAGLEEVIEIHHKACSRGVFAKGAIRAAEFLVSQAPGLYNMNDLVSDL